MLTNDQISVLQYLRKSLNLPVEEISVINWKAVEKIIIRNGILSIVFLSLPASVQLSLNSDYIAIISQLVRQEFEGTKVLKELGEAGVDCIALKGWELKKLYPDSALRQMADLDILVRPYNYQLIRSVMENMDYRCGDETSWMHDNFSKNDVMVEMHKRLTDDSGLIQEWERGIWSRVEKENEHLFRMSPEDYYIFHFIHLHKDFLNGSLGLRRIVDTWLLQKQEMNIDTVREKLKEFGMGTFHERMVKLSHVVMGDEEMDENSEFLLLHAFNHGIYGTDISYKAGRIAVMGRNLRTGKIKSAFSAIFLPYYRMKAQFPVLEKYPLLLPYCWSKRIIQQVKGGLKSKKKMLDYSNIGKDEYNEIKRFLQAGGCI